MLYKFIYKFSYIILISLTIIRFLTRLINKYISQKYVSLLIYSIVNLLLINLSLYIRSKKFKLLTFYLLSLFSFIIMNSKDLNSLNKFY